MRERAVPVGLERRATRIGEETELIRPRIGGEGCNATVVVSPDATAARSPRAVPRDDVNRPIRHDRLLDGAAACRFRKSQSRTRTVMVRARIPSARRI